MGVKLTDNQKVIIGGVIRSSIFLVAIRELGLFKYFSQFKVWKSFSILLLLSVMLNYFFMLNLNTFKLNYNVKNTEIVYAIIPAYFVFLFLNFLTKKFPTPFEQIGYLFSFKFYKSLFKRISKNKFFKNEPFQN